MLHNHAQRGLGFFGHPVTRWCNQCRAPNDNKNINFGAESLIIAPPCAETREHVYEPIQRENQTESIAV